LARKKISADIESCGRKLIEGGVGKRLQQAGGFHFSFKTAISFLIEKRNYKTSIL